MSTYLVLYLFIFVFDLSIYGIADYLDMRNTLAQKIFLIVLNFIINILLIGLIGEL